MKNHLVTVLASLAALAALPVARADTIHSGSFTMDTSAGSTMGWSTNGDSARFNMGTSPYHASNVAARFFGGYPGGTTFLSDTRSLTATLQADSGKIFDKVYVGLTPGGYNNEESGVYSQSTWTVGGGTWSGDAGNYFDNGWASFHEWTATGPNSGESTFYDGYWYRGMYETWGGFWGIPEALNGYYNVGAASLTLDLSIYAQVSNHSYWGASFDAPGLEFYFTYLEAPSTSSVPETGATAGLMLLGLAGLVGARRLGLARATLR